LLAKEMQELRELRQEMRDLALQMAVKWATKPTHVHRKNV